MKISIFSVKKKNDAGWGRFFNKSRVGLTNEKFTGTMNRVEPGGMPQIAENENLQNRGDENFIL